jgi:RimK-like ATP-grasp domain
MTANSALLLTASYDVAAPYVESALRTRGARYFRLDTDRFPGAVKAAFRPPYDVCFTVNDTKIDGHQIKSVWYRRHVTPDLPADLDAGTREFCERESRAFMTGALACLPTSRWLSRPSAIRDAESKPYQLKIAAELGFAIPQTVMTNDPQEVLKLGDPSYVVAKALSSGYIRGENGNRAVFTSRLCPDDFADLDGLSVAPATFQRFVEKSVDIRVTVVEQEVFAAEILSQTRESSRVDWRATDDPHLKHRRHELPETTADLCRNLVSRLGLSYGAIDLALTADGSYVFFEVNPNGEWVWIEDQLGFPISASIAEWLDAEMA